MTAKDASRGTDCDSHFDCPVQRMQRDGVQKARVKLRLINALFCDLSHLRFHEIPIERNSHRPNHQIIRPAKIPSTSKNDDSHRSADIGTEIKGFADAVLQIGIVMRWFGAILDPPMTRSNLFLLSHSTFNPFTLYPRLFIRVAVSRPPLFLLLAAIFAPI
jgi:hypothetical protein